MGAKDAEEAAKMEEAKKCKTKMHGKDKSICGTSEAGVKVKMAGSVEDFNTAKLDSIAADLAKRLHIPADHLKATVTAGSVVVHFFFKGEGTHGVGLVKELTSDFKKGEIGHIGGIVVKGIEPSFEPKPDSKKAGADAYQAAVKAGASSKAAAAAAAAAVAAVKEDATVDQAKAAGAAAATALKAALAAGSSGDGAAAAAKAAGAAAAQGANASKAADVAKAAAAEFKKAVAAKKGKDQAALDAVEKSLKDAGLKVPKKVKKEEKKAEKKEEKEEKEEKEKKEKKEEKEEE